MFVPCLGDVATVAMYLHSCLHDFHCKYWGVGKDEAH